VPSQEPTRVQASEGGIRSAENRRARRDDPEAALEATFAAQRLRLIERLLDAAYARKNFSTLAPDKQLTAIIKALEYSVGKPLPAKATPAEEEAKPRGGLTVE